MRALFIPAYYHKLVQIIGYGPLWKTKYFKTKFTKWVEDPYNSGCEIGDPLHKRMFPWAASFGEDSSFN